MELSEFIGGVTAALRAEGVEYFLTGSIAAMAYSEPRLTIDVDIVVRLDADQARRLVAHFPPGPWYVSETAALEAVRRRSQFNVIEISTGFKADLLVAQDDEFDRSRFARAREFQLFEGASELLASAEDVILKKLVYFQVGGSDKHVQDIAKILTGQKGRIDVAYLDAWAQKLGVDKELQRIVKLLESTQE